MESPEKSWFEAARQMTKEELAERDARIARDAQNAVPQDPDERARWYAEQRRGVAASSVFGRLFG